MPSTFAATATPPPPLLDCARNALIEKDHAIVFPCAACTTTTMCVSVCLFFCVPTLGSRCACFHTSTRDLAELDELAKLRSTLENDKPTFSCVFGPPLVVLRRLRSAAHRNDMRASAQHNLMQFRQSFPSADFQIRPQRAPAS